MTLNFINIIFDGRNNAVEICFGKSFLNQLHATASEVQFSTSIKTFPALTLPEPAATECFVNIGGHQTLFRRCFVVFFPWMFSL